MAQADVQLILEGLKQHTEKLFKEREQEQEQQRIENQRKAQETQAKLEQQRIDEEVKQHGIANKAAKALLDVQLAQHQQQIGQNYQQTGIAPSGTTMSPTASSLPSGEANFTPANPQQATGQMLNVPGVGSMQVASPEAAATRQANIADIAAGPSRKTETLKQGLETQRQVAVTQATQAAETDRQVKLATSAQAAAQALKKLEIEGENHRNAVTAGTQMKIAMLPYSIFQNSDPAARTAMTQPSIDAMSNGDISAKQVRDQFNEKGLLGAGTAVVSSFMSSGGVPPTDKQVDFKKKVQPIIDAVPLIQEYIGLLPKTSGGLSGLASGMTHPDLLNPRLASIEKELEFNIAPVARTLGGDEGQRLQKALLGPAEGGYMPSKFKPTSYNVDNYNKFIKLLNSAVDSSLSSMPAGQRAHIKATMGLTKIPFLDQNGQPVQAAAAEQDSEKVKKIKRDLGIQ
jgi:hypothetical protein